MRTHEESCESCKNLVNPVSAAGIYLSFFPNVKAMERRYWSHRLITNEGKKNPEWRVKTAIPEYKELFSKRCNTAPSLYVVEAR